MLPSKQCISKPELAFWAQEALSDFKTMLFWKLGYLVGDAVSGGSHSVYSISPFC